MLPIWFSEIMHLPQKKKLYMFESMTEILFQTFRHTDIFVKDFAHNLHINFPMIIQNIDDTNIYKRLEELISSWEDNEIYRIDFKVYLLEWLNKRRFFGSSAMQMDEIAMNQKPVYLNEEKIKEDLSVLTKNIIATEIFALQFQERNIQDFYNMNVNSHELDRYLKAHPKMNEEVSFTVNQCEKICKDLRAYVMRDLVRRERTIEALALKAKMLREEFMETENSQQ